MPVDVAISNPVCDDLLILLPTPNLEVIVPETGLIKAIPKLAFAEDVVPAVLTDPEAVYFDVPVDFVLVLAIAVLCAGCTYNFDIASSVETKSFNSTSYFSTIDIFSIFELFFSFNPLTTFSASSKLETYAFSS